MTDPLKVLTISHNHPDTRPGGAEAYALELHRALLEDPRVEPVFVAKGGPPVGISGRTHDGTMFAPVGTHPSEYFLYTDGYDFDWLFGSITDKDFYTTHCRRFLQAIRPDVVHFQHTQFLGYDLIREVRKTLPDAAVVYTLHEYLPICHRDGQMVRTFGDERCLSASPRRCSQCFPHIEPGAFFLRKRFIQSQFSLVDRFLAPSHFLLERYVDWGIPRERIQFEDYGRRPPLAVAGDGDRDRRDRFGFFGQLSAYKGVLVLLEAMRLLSSRSDHRPGPHLFVHGANLDVQDEHFRRRFDELIDLDNVTFVGKYDHDALPSLMENIDWVVVPSVWWENAPLVIQEAFMHGRPVICSDVGGMAEKVEDEVSGMHFRAGQASSLASTIERAVATPDLWGKLRAGIPEVYPMADHTDRLVELYRSILGSRV